MEVVVLKNNRKLAQKVYRLTWARALLIKTRLLGTRVALSGLMLAESKSVKWTEYEKPKSWNRRSVRVGKEIQCVEDKISYQMLLRRVK